MKVVCSFLWLLFMTEHMHAMERATLSFPVNDICYLKRLSIDLCNHIMSFIEWETKKEFIERTQKYGALPAFWVHLKNKHSGPEALFHELCPDKSKIAIVKLLESQNEVKSMLTIIGKNENILYNSTFAHQIYQHIALAQSGYMIATVQKQERPAGETVHDYKNILTIQKIIKNNDLNVIQEIKRVILPDGFASFKLAFNKQNTCVILHGKQCGNTNSHETTYKILKLQDSTDKLIDYIPSKKEKKNTLPLYLRRRMVCKKW